MDLDISSLTLCAAKWLTESIETPRSFSGQKLSPEIFNKTRRGREEEAEEAFEVIALSPWGAFVLSRLFERRSR